MILCLPLSEHGFEGGGELIRAGCGLEAAADALQAGNGVFRLHSFHQSGNTLQIAIAAAGKGNRKQNDSPNSANHKI